MRSKFTEPVLMLLAGLLLAGLTLIFSGCSRYNPVNYQRSIDLNCGGDLECVYLSGERRATGAEILSGVPVAEPGVVFVGSLCPDSVVIFICSSPDAAAALPLVDRWLNANRTGVNVPDVENELKNVIAASDRQTWDNWINE